MIGKDDVPVGQAVRRRGLGRDWRGFGRGLAVEEEGAHQDQVPQTVVVNRTSPFLRLRNKASE